MRGIRNVPADPVDRETGATLHVSAAIGEARDERRDGTWRRRRGSSGNCAIPPRTGGPSPDAYGTPAEWHQVRAPR
jgi:hypothetical protein